MAKILTNVKRCGTIFPMETKIQSVAIDGPAGVGKSTAAKLLAQKLGWAILETGAIYRAITVNFITKNLPLENEDVLAKAVQNLPVQVVYKNQKQHLFVEGVDLTPYLRTPIVDQNVALVAKVPAVREAVRAVQRQIATSQNIVVEGRDIGTVVLPESQNKFFLTASPQVRAQRRFKELVAKGGEVPNFSALLADIQKRDEMDKTRAVSPLLPAQDAIIINTDHLEIESVVHKMALKILRKDQDLNK
ncbi:MAG: (d)CMP kinase [Clostridia bacterium]|nr:(d)CMP kinase [Clostridia bacterium]MBR3790932.1 (d)CMP kinase [Clostridia bacterium]